MVEPTPPAPHGATNPNNTIYINNLAERIKPAHLLETLTTIFASYGRILEIVAKPSLKRKGQAFIVFDTADAAARALHEVNGFPIFDQPMKIAFARTRSDATVRAAGDADEFEVHKRRRLAEKERRQAMEAQAAQNRMKRPAGEQAPAPAKRAVKGAGLKSTGGAAAVVPDEYLPPNKILFVQNVPEDYDVEMLSAVFARFEGFREVRTVPGRTGIAFVEYEGEVGAISAKESTAGMQLKEGQGIKVTFQRQ